MPHPKTTVDPPIADFPCELSEERMRHGIGAGPIGRGWIVTDRRSGLLTAQVIVHGNDAPAVRIKHDTIAVLPANGSQGSIAATRTILARPPEEAAGSTESPWHTSLFVSNWISGLRLLFCLYSSLDYLHIRTTGHQRRR
jgi:hypothetical protein